MTTSAQYSLYILYIAEIRKIVSGMNDSQISCSVLEKSHIGAKSDFEIWGFKGFFSLDPKKGPKEGL